MSTSLNSLLPTAEWYSEISDKVQKKSKKMYAPRRTTDGLIDIYHRRQTDKLLLVESWKVLKWLIDLAYGSTMGKISYYRLSMILSTINLAY